MDYFALLVISVIAVAPSMLLIAGILFIASKIKDKKKPTLAKHKDATVKNLDYDQINDLFKVENPYTKDFLNYTPGYPHPGNLAAIGTNDDH